MRAAIIDRRIGSLPALSRSGKRINGLHRMMRSSHLFERAYARIARNRGALTAGIDGETFDGMSLEKLALISRQVAEGAYRPRPVRRVYIPKANGKLRPLGIPTVEDRLVQEVVRIILEAIYEPVFLDEAHGFRPRRSCHTALRAIQRNWTGVKWLIEVDVRGFFDAIDHDILLRLLERRIDDPRFIDLIKNMLEAGYLEDWTLNETHSGTPQGGVVSPLLANIYLHELDLFMETMQAGFDRGTKRRDHELYRRLGRRTARLRRQIDALRAKGAEESAVTSLIERISAIDKEMRSLPTGDPMDPNFRRLRYCRYADDFLIGVIGGKQEARDVMSAVQIFLGTTLNLSVSPEKSGIHHASNGSRFLGYHVCTTSSLRPTIMAERQRRGGGTRRVPVRPPSGVVQLRVPRDRVVGFCGRNGYGDLQRRRPHVRPQLLHASDLEIAAAYNAELRGFATYYLLAQGVKRSLGLLAYMASRSLFKTLAARHRSGLAKIKKRLRSGADFVVRENGRSLTVWQLKHLDPTPRMGQIVDMLDIPAFMPGRWDHLIVRLKSRICEACGDTSGPFEVHQTRTLVEMVAELSAFGPSLAQPRKTLVLCSSCHAMRHRTRQV